MMGSSVCYDNLFAMVEHCVGLMLWLQITPSGKTETNERSKQHLGAHAIGFDGLKFKHVFIVRLCRPPMPHPSLSSSASDHNT
jgi:hypothetical protein